jgi:hypothetical protein
MDVHGNDNAPEWGWCRHPDGCREDALPLWLSGDFPDDPDLRLCQRHIGLHIAGLTEVLRALWGAAGTITEGENTGDAECRYCHADEYPADEQGTEVGWEDEAATQYLIDHEPWCPSARIDRAFDGLDDVLVARVLEGLSTERPDEEQAG